MDGEAIGWAGRRAGIPELEGNYEYLRDIAAHEWAPYLCLHQQALKRQQQTDVKNGHVQLERYRRTPGASKQQRLATAVVLAQDSAPVAEHDEARPKRPKAGLSPSERRGLASARDASDDATRSWRMDISVGECLGCCGRRRDELYRNIS